MSHAALVRGEDGGLAVRRFAHAADARAHNDQREVLPEVRGRTKATWSPERVGRLIGVSGRTIARRCEQDLLPFVDQGTADRPRRMLTDDTVRLIRIHGLGGVARLRQAGQL